MPDTRDALLAALKKRGEARAEELAGEIGITVSAIRQHLGSLSGEGLVTHSEVKGGPGRPKHVFRLTAAAEGLFPKTYAELANELLDYASAEDPALVERLFDRRRRRRIAQARARLAGKHFADKVAELARILDEDGYLAEWQRVDDGFLVVEHNCAILGVALRYGSACSSEIDFIRAVLPEAAVERTRHMVAGAHECAYAIRPKARPKTPAHARPRTRAAGSG